MAQSLLVAWDYDGEMTHIESAICFLREAVEIGKSLPDMLDYAIALNTLSEAIQSQLRLSMEEVDECVSLDTLALTFVPKGHRERPLVLSALATTILVRYTISFQSDDFARYHALHDELKSMLDTGYHDMEVLADYWALTQNIGPYHADRYALTFIFRQRLYILRAETLPEQRDIKAFYTRSLAPNVFLRRMIDPVGQERVLMGGFTLLQRVPSEDDRQVVRGNIAWKCRGKPYVTVSSDFLPLQGSIQDVEKEWLAFMPVPDNHPWASAFYFQLSRNLLHFEDACGFEAVQRAQVYAHRALTVHQSHLLWGYQILSHLALLYILQAEKECESSEEGSTSPDVLDQSLHYTKLALETCPPHCRSDIQVYAVDAYIMRYKLHDDLTNLSSAIEICRECSLDSHIDVWDRYTFVERFVEIAKEFKVHLLEALLTHVDVSYDIISTHFTMPKVIEHVGDLELSEAVATAVEHCFTVGEYETALQVLEKARGMLWARLVQLQAHRLRRESMSANDVAQLELILEAAAEERSKAEKENMPWKRILNLSCRQRRLEVDVRRLMDRVQQDRPNLQAEDTRLFKDAVLHGVSPVVVLFAGVHRCDGLVISGPEYTVQHVPLPECTRETLDRLAEKVNAALKDDGLLQHSLRVAVRLTESWDTPQDSFEDALADIWSVIVEPILKALQLKPSPCPSRLWWYPTGPFWQIPLHAAGLYRPEDYDGSTTSIQDYVVSSYLPPFNTTLTRSLAKESIQPAILAVYQCGGLRSGRTPLFNAEPEVRKIEEIARERGIPITVLGEHHVTVDSISRALSEATIVHFALHRQQHSQDAMESSLLLDNGTELKLSQLMEMNLPNAELVFLSACQTATGDQNISEEVIHIAAAMLFVGFRSAIGTMWSINDKDGPKVAGETYRYLLNNSMDPARSTSS